MTGASQKGMHVIAKAFSAAHSSFWGRLNAQTRITPGLAALPDCGDAGLLSATDSAPAGLQKPPQPLEASALRKQTRIGSGYCHAPAGAWPRSGPGRNSSPHPNPMLPLGGRAGCCRTICAPDSESCGDSTPFLAMHRLANTTPAFGSANAQLWLKARPSVQLIQ